MKVTSWNVQRSFDLGRKHTVHQTLGSIGWTNFFYLEEVKITRIILRTALAVIWLGAQLSYCDHSKEKGCVIVLVSPQFSSAIVDPKRKHTVHQQLA
jgi:hypothetical protein